MLVAPADGGRSRTAPGVTSVGIGAVTTFSTRFATNTGNEGRCGQSVELGSNPRTTIPRPFWTPSRTAGPFDESAMTVAQGVDPKVVSCGTNRPARSTESNRGVVASR